ncbi:MAG: alpha/beta hydrolase [Clostridiales bacterium]|nr:alpha/beta hydrolase [Clostridiales bacterium]
MKKEKLWIPSRDGKRSLHCVLWQPDSGQVRAVVQIVHGMEEYVERYEDFALYLTSRGIAVIGHDMLGHGQSVREPKEMGFFTEQDGDQVIVDDVESVALRAQGAFPFAPLVLLAHSMGSFVVRRYITQYTGKARGVILMGTGIVSERAAKAAGGVANLLCLTRGATYHSKWLENRVVGRFNRQFTHTRTGCDWLSRDVENVDRYLQDPLCGICFTVGGYRDFFKLAGHLAREEDFEQITSRTPMLLISGEKDPVGHMGKDVPRLTRQYQKWGVTDVTYKLWKDDRHELLNEADREDIYGWLLGWIESHVLQEYR